MSKIWEIKTNENYLNFYHEHFIEQFPEKKKKKKIGL